jgi:hypothetical protein
MRAIRALATSSLLGVDDGVPSTMRMSSAALRPSVEILSMLSSSGATRRARTASARSPSSAT